jgi:hypothetical protein
MSIQDGIWVCVTSISSGTVMRGGVLMSGVPVRSSVISDGWDSTCDERLLTREEEEEIGERLLFVLRGWVIVSFEGGVADDESMSWYRAGKMRWRRPDVRVVVVVVDMMPIQVELPASPSQSVCKRLMIGRDYAGKRGLSREYSQNRPAIEKVKKKRKRRGWSQNMYPAIVVIAALLLI